MRGGLARGVRPSGIREVVESSELVLDRRLLTDLLPGVAAEVTREVLGAVTGGLLAVGLLAGFLLLCMDLDVLLCRTAPAASAGCRLLGAVKGGTVAGRLLPPALPLL